MGKGGKGKGGGGGGGFNPPGRGGGGGNSTFPTNMRDNGGGNDRGGGGGYGNSGGGGYDSGYGGGSSQSVTPEGIAEVAGQVFGTSNDSPAVQAFQKKLPKRSGQLHLINDHGGIKACSVAFKAISAMVGTSKRKKGKLQSSNDPLDQLKNTDDESAMYGDESNAANDERLWNVLQKLSYNDRNGRIFREMDTNLINLMYRRGFYLEHYLYLSLFPNYDPSSIRRAGPGEGLPAVLMVAEKPSIAKIITEHLSGGRYKQRRGPSHACQTYEFVHHGFGPAGGKPVRHNKDRLAVLNSPDVDSSEVKIESQIQDHGNINELLRLWI